MEQLLLVNPRPLTRHASRRGPKRLKNLPPALRRYWQRVRGMSRRRTNPRSQRRKRVPSRGSPMAHSRPRRNPRRLSAHQRRSRAAKKAARTRARRRSAFRGAVRRHRRAPSMYAVNPRRRIRYRSNPRRHGMRFGSTANIKRLAVGAGIGAVGAVGLDYLWQYASGYLPASLQSGYVGTFAKAAVAVGAGWLAGKAVGKPTAAAAVGGALTVILYQLAHQMIASASPAAAIPATTTAATPALSGMNAYMLNAYMPHSMGRLGWTSPGTPLRGLGARPGPTAAHWGGGGMQLPTFAAGRPGGTVSASGLASAGSW